MLDCRLVTINSVATGGQVPTPAPAVLGHGIRADPKSSFGGKGKMEDGLG